MKPYNEISGLEALDLEAAALKRGDHAEAKVMRAKIAETYREMARKEAESKRKIDERISALESSVNRLEGKRSGSQLLRQAKQRAEYLGFALACLLHSVEELKRSSKSTTISDAQLIDKLQDVPSNAEALSMLVNEHDAKWPGAEAIVEPDTGAGHIRKAFAPFRPRRPQAPS